MFKWDDWMLHFYLTEQEMKEVMKKHNKLEVPPYSSSTVQPTEGGVLPFLCPLVPKCSIYSLLFVQYLKCLHVCLKHKFRISEWLHRE